MSEDRLEIEIEGGWETLPAAQALTEAAANAALDREDAGGITLLLTTDAVLADLNSRFRGKAGPTNVLSFPAAPNPERHLGDIALAYETCVREADEQGKSVEHHLQHLVAHGVLHLLGYDHETEADALVMEDLERRVLSTLGIADPYAWRVDDHG